MIKFYESWAHTYDSDMNQIESEDAGCLASPLTHWLTMAGHHVGDVSVLDVAAGTGLVGEKLHEDGYRDITAKDVPVRSFDAVVGRICCGSSSTGKFGEDGFVLQEGRTCH